MFVLYRLLQEVSSHKEADSLRADDLVKVAKITFTDFGLSKKIISGAGTNFTSDTSSYHHQSNGHVKACIKFAKCTIKNALIIIVMSIQLYCRHDHSPQVQQVYIVLSLCYLTDQLETYCPK